MALVNQKTGERQGNANYVLYKLAAQQPTAFHDISTNTNAMPCATGSPNCTTGTADDAYGVLSGYNAVAGYDMATGLGSVDANNLVTKWNSVTLLPSTTTLSNVNPTTITHGQTVSFTASVAPKTGTGTPTGTISLEGPSTSYSTAQGIAGFTLSSGTVTGTTEMLPGGTYSLTAHYPGDSTYGPSDSSPISVTVSKENSQLQAFLVTFDSNGNVINGNTNTATYGTPYLLRVNVENSAGKVCAPTATTGATACPTGTVTLTNNGSTLDAGTYTLNSYGYAEDVAVQLPGGADSIKAVYAGDDSFSASSATTPITITPASTLMLQPFVSGAAVGQSAAIFTTVNTTSSGAAPSGTVTFYANGTALTGTTTYTPSNGSSAGSAYLQATLTSSTNAFPSSGNYAVTATYNGDANYSTSTSSPDNITVIYPTPNVNVTPYSQTVSFGGTASITVLVDTTNKSVYPTGTVTFLDSTGATVATATCTNAKDSSGNFACQVVGTFTVTSGGSVQVKYSGDTNFPSAYSWAYTAMPDFQLSQGGIQVTAGQSQNLTVTIQSLNGFTGTVSNFACSGLPAETTCTFNPSQVTLSNNGSANMTLTVTTTAIGQSLRGSSKRLRSMNWGLVGTSLLIAACFTGIRLRRRGGRIIVAIMLVALCGTLPSCGGGSNGGGGGTPNPVPSISSLSPAQVAAGSQVQNLYINGSNFMSTSTVTYGATPRNSSLQSANQIQIALEPSDVATTGQFPVVVTNPGPGGGPSAPVSFSVLSGTPTGTFYATLTASSGPITHSVELFILVQ